MLLFFNNKLLLLRVASGWKHLTSESPGGHTRTTRRRSRLLNYVHRPFRALFIHVRFLSRQPVRLRRHRYNDTAAATLHNIYKVLDFSKKKKGKNYYYYVIIIFIHQTVVRLDNDLLVSRTILNKVLSPKSLCQQWIL